VNDQKKDECVLEDVYILMTDHEISNILQIETVLKPIVAGGHKLLIIAPCSNQVTTTLAANVIKNGLKLCAIAPPQFGYKQHELMGDIAASVGGRFISEGMGDELSLVTMADLGHAAKVIVGKDSTVIVRKEGTSAEVNARVNELWSAHDQASKKGDRDFIKQRIASLTGGVGIIYVGGSSDVEQKETYDRVEDAVQAVRSAIEEGILPGGGVALCSIGDWMEYNIVATSEEMRLANRIMSQAMMEPAARIVENAGLDFMEVTEGVTANTGLNVKTMEYGDMYDMGVIDPLKVTKNALRNAVSVATTILSTNAIITLARSYEDS
jgi:chaperonin GroEL